MLALCLLLPAIGKAEFTTFSQVELLYSTAYDHREKSNEGIVSLKNASSFAYGDSFRFGDFQNAGNSHNAGSGSAEWGPRLSLGKTFGDGPVDKGIIHDVYTMIELNYVYNQDFSNVIRLGGVSVDLNMPGFAFFKVHALRRSDPRQIGNSWQGTLVWNMPFRILGQDFVFEGFADYGERTGNTHPTLITQPALVWKTTERFNMGLEYQYWYNKFGVHGLMESAMQGMVRWNF